MDEFGAQSVMLIGDFNVHHPEWLGSNVTAAGRRAQQLANCLGLDQIVSEPTRGDNILDLVLSDTPATTKTLANIGSICSYFTILLQDAMAVFIPNKTITRNPGLMNSAEKQPRKSDGSTTRCGPPKTRP